MNRLLERIACMETDAHLQLVSGPYEPGDHERPLESMTFEAITIAWSRQ
jgi:hypothetical protein